MNNLETSLSSKLTGPQLREAIARMRALPRYASEWERRVVALGFDETDITDAVNVLRTMRDTQTCPSEWLFLLAWDLSVDVWDADWPESVKRRVCEASWVVHRYKGTQYAIESSLRALGMRVSLKRWFEFAPPLEPGTFEATVFVEEQLYADETNLLNSRQQQAAFEAIWRSKPLTRHFTFKLGVGTRGSAVIAHANTALAIDKMVTDIDPLSDEAGAIAIGSAITQMALDRAHCEVL